MAQYHGTDDFYDAEDAYDEDLQRALLLSQTMGTTQAKPEVGGSAIPMPGPSGWSNSSPPAASSILQNSAKKYSIDQVPYKDIYYKLRTMFSRCDDEAIRKLLIEPPFAADLYSESERLIKFADLCAQLNEIHGADENESKLKENGSNLVAVYENLLTMFPDADETYIYNFAQKNYQNEEVIEKFIEDNLKDPKYLTTEKCLERAELRLNYVTNFNVAKFVEAYHDPVEYFEDPNRKCPYSYQALQYLRKVYGQSFKINELHKIFTTLNNNLVLTIKKLDEESAVKSYNRSRLLDDLLNTTDVNLLMDVVYLKNKGRVLKFMEKKDEKEYREIRNCIKNKLFIECECCLVEYIPSRIIICTSDHSFCKGCVKKSVEVKMSDANFTTSCILNCGSQFQLSDIQKILKPSDYRKFVLKWQEAEVKKAEIDGLVSCPFCNYSAILPEDNKIFDCMNPECRKISCRFCKKVNHSPDPCDAKVKARHMLEEEMTKALIRHCYKCKKSYIKTDGCNFIHCQCGASMCYFCEQPITSYAHFGRDGNSCQTYTDNFNENQGRVRTAAEKKSREILDEFPDMKRDTERLMRGISDLGRPSISRAGINFQYQY